MHISHFLTIWYGHHSSVLEPHCRYKIPINPVKYAGWEFFALIAFYLGNSRRYAHSCYGTLIGSRSIGVSSNDLSDLVRRGARGQIFLVDFHNYVRAV